MLNSFFTSCTIQEFEGSRDLSLVKILWAALAICVSKLISGNGSVWLRILYGVQECPVQVAIRLDHIEARPRIC